MIAPPPARSRLLPRQRDEAPEPAIGDSAMSQLRRRSDLEAEHEARLAPREPGFLEDEPEDGVPTPRRAIPLSSVPVRIVDDAQLRTFPLDHRAGFVLAHMDGATDIGTLIDLCGMSHDEVVAVVQQLLSLRVVRLA